MPPSSSKARQNARNFSRIADAAGPILDWLRDHLSEGVRRAFNRVASLMETALRTQWVVDLVAYGLTFAIFGPKGAWLAEIVELLLIGYLFLSALAVMLRRMSGPAFLWV